MASITSRVLSERRSTYRANRRSAGEAAPPATIFWSVSTTW